MRKIRKLWKIGIVLLCIAILLGVTFFVVITRGPLSQSAQVAEYTAINVQAIEQADLIDLDESLPRSWKAVPGFQSPWTPPFSLAFFFKVRNGPLEGAKMDRAEGNIVEGIPLIMTHRWMNGKRWGLAYNPRGEEIPLPFWSKHLEGDWHVWYFVPDRKPTRENTWYE